MSVVNGGAGSGRRELRVTGVGGAALIQDLGRLGWAHLGVSPSGATDRAAHRRANALVGNAAAAATVEVLLGGFSAVADAPLTLAVSGARCPIEVVEPTGRRQLCVESVFEVASGGRVELGPAASGLRCYLAVRGGLAVDPVLGSRSTDTLSGLGPAPMRPGDVVPVGAADGPDVAGWPTVDLAVVPPPPEPSAVVSLPILPGPRIDWLSGDARRELTQALWRVSPDSDRIGLRFAGPPLARARTEDPPSEGMVRGGVQLPASGLPVVFLADHPATGGYPIVAVLTEKAADLAAQLRPGQPVRLTPA